MQERRVAFDQVPADLSGLSHTISRANRLAGAIVPIFFLVCFAINFALIIGHVVDFPYMDDWDYVRPDALRAVPSLPYVFHQNAEHRQVVLHLQSWLLYWLADWNLVTGASINYLIFGTVIFLLLRIGKLQLDQRNWILWFFLIALLTPFNPFHQFGILFVGNVHYTVFFLLSILLLFGNSQRNWHTVAGSLAAVVSCYSAGAGAVTAVSSVGLYGLFRYVRIVNGRVFRNEIVHFVTAFFIIVPPVALWFLFLDRGAHLPKVTLPITVEFWRFYFALNSLAVGRPGEIWTGAALFVLAIAPLALTVVQLRKGDSSAWIRAAFTVGVVATGISMTAARAGSGFQKIIETWHYHAFVVLLIPICVLGWCAVLSGFRLAVFLVAFGTGLVWLMHGTFSADLFQNRENRVEAGRKCVVEKMVRGVPVDCPISFHSTLDQKLLLAKERKLSFYQRLDQTVEQMRAAQLLPLGAPYRIGDTIDFTNAGNSPRYKISGWSIEESWATWTIGNEARVVLQLDGSQRSDLQIEADIVPHVQPNHAQVNVDVAANGETIGRWRFGLQDAKGTQRRVTIPAVVANRSSSLDLTFRIDSPVSPAELGTSKDERKLGIAIMKLAVFAMGRK